MHNQINDIIELVGLHQVLHSLPNGFDTKLITDGYPLQEEHIILLKIAKSILLEPLVIIITGIFDKVNKQQQQKILNYIVNNTNITLICFSVNEDNQIHYDNFIFLTNNATYETTDREQFHNILEKYQYKV